MSSRSSSSMSSRSSLIEEEPIKCGCTKRIPLHRLCFCYRPSELDSTKCAIEGEEGHNPKPLATLIKDEACEKHPELGTYKEYQEKIAQRKQEGGRLNELLSIYGVNEQIERFEKLSEEVAKVGELNCAAFQEFIRGSQSAEVSKLVLEVMLAEAAGMFEKMRRSGGIPKSASSVYESLQRLLSSKEKASAMRTGREMGERGEGEKGGDGEERADGEERGGFY